MNENDYVSVQIAKLANKKGFNIPLLSYYNEKNELIEETNPYFDLHRNSDVLRWFKCNSAPTYLMLKRWLIDSHKILVNSFDENDFIDALNKI